MMESRSGIHKNRRQVNWGDSAMSPKGVKQQVTPAGTDCGNPVHFNGEVWCVGADGCLKAKKKCKLEKIEFKTDAKYEVVADEGVKIKDESFDENRKRINVYRCWCQKKKFTQFDKVISRRI
jgi:hypothetical protein